MNSQQPPHEALDAEEREFARVVRALPGGEPPPALDAFILKAAQNAVAAAPSHRRRPWMALGSVWGASSAAAAVLALGVGWQLLNPPGGGVPVADSAPIPTASVSKQEQSTDVDFIHRQPQPTPEAPPLAMAPPPMESVSPAAKARVASPATDQPQRQEIAADHVAEPFIDEHVAGMSASEADGFAEMREQEVGSGPTHGALAQSNQAMAKASAPAAPAAVAQATAAPSVARVNGEAAAERGADAAAPVLDRVEVSGSRIRADAGRAGPDKPRTRAIASSNAADRDRVAADSMLNASAWQEKIRQRRRDGDMSGAHASLVLYLERHPGSLRTLPRDIRQLLQK